MCCGLMSIIKECVEMMLTGNSVPTFLQSLQEGDFFFYIVSKSLLCENWIDMPVSPSQVI